MWDPVSRILFVSNRNTVAKIDLRNVVLGLFGHV